MQAPLLQPILLSCKLTHAVLKFLERRGEDLEPLYERFDWPLYYLRDSSSWLEADRLEYVLKMLDEVYGRRVADETGVDFFSAVGHASPSLRAWGALDSVLKIVPGVRQLYQQPDRFLASFISPQPQIQGLQHSDESVVFRIGFSDDRMPHTARYLRAILESLPEFIGKPRTHVMWNHGNVSIEWSERQVPFVSQTQAPENEGPSLSPELLRTILVDLSSAQRELENARRSIQEKDALIAAMQAAPLATGLEHLKSPAVEKALHEIYKLGDYFARAQQIVTLLRAPPRATPGLSGRVTAPLISSQTEALIKRTAWDRVSLEAPIAIRKAAMFLRGEEVVDETSAAPLTDVPPTLDPMTSGKTSPKLKAAAAKTLRQASAALAGSASLKSKTPSFFDHPDHL